MIRVLLADDEAMVREGIRLIVENEDDIEVVGVAGDGGEAVDAVLRLHPDVVLMDIRMPVVDGLEATRRLAAANAAAHVIVLTTFDNDEYVYEALKSGASGFMLKSAPRDQLIGAVRVAARGEELLAPSITRRLIEEFVRRPAPGRRPASLQDLTDREVDVLRLIGRGLSNEEICQELFISYATVKTHIGRIFSKLDLRDRAQAVVAAYESGLVRAGDNA
ncbi:MAG TPA: response regulator transcription factor [Thermoleophilaceae bacterium]|nr:response regulator transcription factor [Thermoleophilaceae bacterium]